MISQIFEREIIVRDRGFIILNMVCACLMIIVDNPFVHHVKTLVVYEKLSA